MGSHGIPNRVAIVGMGCTPFGELWDKSVDDLLIDAATEAVASTNLDFREIDAFWLGTFGSGVAGTTLSKPLKIDYKPVSRNENFCATGSEAFRNACYAVAAGAYDVAMAIGVEKVKDAGLSGLPFSLFGDDGTSLEVTPVGTFSNLAIGYAKKYGLDMVELKEALTHIAWKNHRNGALNSRAQFRKELSKDMIACAPPLAGNLSLLDCGGVADGAAAAIIVRAEDAERYTDKPVYVKGISFVVGPGTGQMDPSYDYSTFPEVVASAEDAYSQANINDPRGEIALAEVHDCFTVTEILLLEDLGIAGRGMAWKEMLAGTFDLDGELPINPDGGLKSFGHPLGASGIRMLFECWLQLRGEAGDRQVDNGRRLTLTQNLGGHPGECVSFVSILGAE